MDPDSINSWRILNIELNESVFTGNSLQYFLLLSFLANSNLVYADNLQLLHSTEQVFLIRGGFYNNKHTIPVFLEDYIISDSFLSVQ